MYSAIASQKLRDLSSTIEERRQKYGPRDLRFSLRRKCGLWPYNLQLLKVCGLVKLKGHTISIFRDSAESRLPDNRFSTFIPFYLTFCVGTLHFISMHSPNHAPLNTVFISDIFSYDTALYSLRNSIIS